ncbi:MAG: TIGR00730 family Rossman fold protein [Saprospiraceae bacterium]
MNDHPDMNLHSRVPREMKKWTELKGENSWTMFKVIAEMVEGFEVLNRVGPCISIFGSARTKPEDLYYGKAVEIGKRLTDEGYGIITGGGPGIMEAGNKGAFDAKGVSVGLGIDLPFEKSYNKFVDPDKNLKYRYFFIRKVMFVKYAQGFVVMPGGFGTLDEFFEVLTLVQTKKINRVPIILFGSDYWEGLRDWIVKTVDQGYHNINSVDMDLFHITDDIESVVYHINAFYGARDDRYKPNYEL